MFTTGGVLFTEIIILSVDDAPSLSVTVNLTTYLVGVLAGAVKLCEGLATALVAPSPKFHAYAAIVPSGSEELIPVKFTASGDGPKSLSEFIFTTGD